MPTLNTPTLTLGNSISNKREVMVAGKITFDEGDVGKTYNLQIKVYGEDKVGDRLPAGDAVGDDLLFTYRWPPHPLGMAFKKITVLKKGTVSFSEKRAVDTAILDEDPGTGIVSGPSGLPPLKVPLKDEVYARVSLTVAPISVRTDTVIAGGWI